MNKTFVRVLLVEDDEDDYVLLKDVVSEIKYLQIELTWADSYNAALEFCQDDVYDIYLVDYILGGFTGFDLLSAFKSKCIRKPAIILTGQGDHDIDIQAMQEGAYDYLEKDKITPQLFEKSIRYTMKQAAVIEALRESENQLRILSGKLIDAQEAERKRIAKELHDSISSNLAAIKFEIQRQMNSPEKDASGEIGRFLDHVQDLVSDTIEETQRIYSNLHPAILDDLGVLMGIHWVCRKFCRTYANISVESDLKIEEEQIPEPTKIVIYRMVQEALNNVAKHSGADRVSIVFDKSDGKLALTIRDNGNGFDLKAKHIKNECSTGMGLMSMKERVSNSGGQFSIRSDGKTGTEIQAVWPEAQRG